MPSVACSAMSMPCFSRLKALCWYREAPMNVQLPVHMDKAAFLAWVQGLEGRYELANGRVVMMVGASRAHALIVRNLLALLQGQLDSQLWTVLADFGIDAGPETLRYPD